MTSDKNLPEGSNFREGMKAWTAPHFEIIRMDKIKSGSNHHGEVEGSKATSMGSYHTHYTTYDS